MANISWLIKENNFEALFFIVVVLIGIVTSYSDIKYKKIKNRHLLVLFLLALSVFLLSVGISAYSHSVNIRYVAETIINFIIAFILAFLFWKKKVWAGGDAKLFALYAFAVPISVYKKDYIVIFPAFSLLVNMFVIASIYYLFGFIIKPDTRMLKKALKESLNYKEIVVSLLNFFGFYWVFYMIGIKNMLAIYALIMASSFAIEKLMKNKKIFAFAALSIVRLAFDKSIYSFSSLSRFSLYFAVYVLLRGIVYNIAEFGFEKEIKVKELEDNDIVTKRFVAGKITRIRKTNKRLNRKKIKELKERWPEEFITVSKATSFAVFMFVGAVLTFLIQRNVVYFIIESFK